MIERYTDIIPEDQLDVIRTMIQDPARIWRWQLSDHVEKNQHLFLRSDLTDPECDFWATFVDPCLLQYHCPYNLILKDAYINLNIPGLGGNWHLDTVDPTDQGITVLYYPALESLGLGGGTEFRNLGIMDYIPNSMIIFPARIEHRAEPHSQLGTYRFTVAFKLRPKTPL